LKHGKARRAFRRLELIPSLTHRAACVYRVTHQPRLVIGEIAVGQPVHQAITERIQLLGDAILRNAATAGTTGQDKRGHTDRHGSAHAREGGVRRCGEIHVEQVLVDVRGAVVDAPQKNLCLSCGRESAGRVQIARQQAVVKDARGEADLLGCGITYEHLGALVGARDGTNVAASVWPEVVLAFVIGVGPDTPFRVIGEAA
jgi:hypothetical protein